MNDIHSIRDQLGFTQSQLAEYLGISRSSVNMFERNDRPIPTPVLLKLAALQIKLRNTHVGPVEINDHKAIPGSPLQKKEHTETNEINPDDHNIKRSRLLQKLTGMKEQYKGLEQIRVTLERLLKDHDAGDPTHTYWEMQLQQVLLKARHCDPESQDNLNRKIKALTKDAATDEPEIK